MEGMTVLELAEFTGNRACFNVAASFLNVPLLAEAIDEKPREDAFIDALLPRIEVHVLHGHGQKSVEKFELPDDGLVSWQELAQLLRRFLPQALGTMTAALPIEADDEDQRHVRPVEIVIHRAAIRGPVLSQDEAKDILAAAPGACEGVNLCLLAQHARRLELYRFGFRGCFVEADLPSTTLCFLRAATEPTGVPSPLAPHVRCSFGFVPWWRRSGGRWEKSLFIRTRRPPAPSPRSSPRTTAARSSAAAGGRGPMWTSGGRPSWCSTTRWATR